MQKLLLCLILSALGYALLARMPTFATVSPWALSMPTNSRLDNGLFCWWAASSESQCPGGWEGLFIDRYGVKFPDVWYDDTDAAQAGQVSVRTPRIPYRPPGYATWTHPKFQCWPLMRCEGPGGWGWRGKSDRFRQDN